MIDLKAVPFNLGDEDIKWVNETLESLTTEEKIGQLFCLTDIITDVEALKGLVKKYSPGGFMYRAGNGAEIQEAYRAMQGASKVPMLLPCNLEAGGNGISPDGTYFAKPLGVSATGEELQAERLGYVSSLEGASVGCNLAYAPIVDIDMNWRNPITNVRTFGSNPETVLKMARAWVKGNKASGADIAYCIKHFPGDGVDERDQHLMPTVNSLSVEEWENSYGKVYRNLINEGAPVVMAGHIIQPALTRKYAGDIKDSEILPGSVNKYLLTDLLRNDMGFNGLITTDATPMVGFSSMQKRSEALCSAIMAGADMLVFCKNMDEDYDSIRQGLKQGRITEERLNEAVLRQLALKASLGLHKKQVNGNLVPDASALCKLGCEEHKAWAKECADKAVTLVKDNQKLLPISPDKYKKVRLTVLGEDESGSFGESDVVTAPLKEALEKAGFVVQLYDTQTLERGEIFTSGVADIKEKFDLSIVVANYATGSNNTVRRINWITLMAANEPWYMKDIPVMFISFSNPYHMIDVPFISTFINCYSSNGATVDAVVDKITGRSEFKGISPVDATCGGVWGCDFM